METIPNRPDARSGYTFVEIIVALVLLSVMTSLAVPSMTGFMDRSTTRGALDQLVGEIGHARMLAVQQGRRVAVNIETGATFRVDTLSDGGVWGAYRTVDLSRDYRGVVFVGGSASLQFSSRGLLVNQADDGFIKIARNGARDSIYVSPAGRLYRDY